MPFAWHSIVTHGGISDASFFFCPSSSIVSSKKTLLTTRWRLKSIYWHCHLAALCILIIAGHYNVLSTVNIKHSIFIHSTTFSTAASHRPRWLPAHPCSPKALKDREPCQLTAQSTSGLKDNALQRDLGKLNGFWFDAAVFLWLLRRGGMSGSTPTFPSFLLLGVGTGLRT